MRTSKLNFKKLLILSEKVNQMFAHNYFLFEFNEDRDFHLSSSESGRAWALQTLGDASMVASLLAIRELDLFFTPKGSRRKWRNDIRAFDFDYELSGTILTASERDMINQIIVHITDYDIQERLGLPDLFELISKAIAQISEFLIFVERSCTRVADEDWTLIRSIRTRLSAQLDWVQNQVAQREKENDLGKRLLLKI